MIQDDPLAQSESLVHTVVPHLPHELHTWLPPIVAWHALNPVLVLGLHPLYVDGKAYEDELNACKPMPQVVALVPLTTPVVEDAAGAELLVLEDTTLLTPEALDVAEAAAVVALSADDISELRLASSAEFVMVLTGTNVEPTRDTLVTTDGETELASDEVGLPADTKLRLVVGAEDEVLIVAAAFTDVLYRLC